MYLKCINCRRRNVSHCISATVLNIRYLDNWTHTGSFVFTSFAAMSCLLLNKYQLSHCCIYKHPLPYEFTPVAYLWTQYLYPGISTAFCMEDVRKLSLVLSSEIIWTEMSGMLLYKSSKHRVKAIWYHRIDNLREWLMVTCMDIIGCPGVCSFARGCNLLSEVFQWPDDTI